VPGLADHARVLEDELALEAVELGSEDLGDEIDDRSTTGDVARDALDMAVEDLGDLVFGIDGRRARLLLGEDSRAMPSTWQLKTLAILSSGLTADGLGSFSGKIA
jgi:hypothetical protein